MKPRHLRASLPVLLLAAALAVGCHKKNAGHDHDHDHDHDHGEETPAGASFKPERGVLLAEETRRLIGLETAEVTMRPLPRTIRFLAQVFGEKHSGAELDTNHLSCVAKASGLLSPADAALLRPGLPALLAPTTERPPWHGLVLDVHPALALGDAEVIVGITNAATQLKAGDFLSATVSLPRAEPVLAVPGAALLRTAEGTFVYVVNGDAYLRVPVRVGPEAEGFVEVTGGLKPEVTVVTKPVEKLWLIELRAVKGGGHSH